MAVDQAWTAAATTGGQPGEEGIWEAECLGLWGGPAVGGGGQGKVRMTQVFGSRKPVTVSTTDRKK